MNVFSGDIAKPTHDIAARDDQSALSDKESTAPKNVEETSSEFATALANLTKPDAQTKHNNIVARKPVETNITSEHTAPVVGVDKHMTQPNHAVQHVGDPKGFVVDVKLDAKAAAAMQSTPNIINSGNINSGQDIRQETNKLVASKPTADVPVINTGLIKNAQPVLANISKPKTGQHQSNGNVFVDIESTQEKIIPNKVSIEATAILQPKQQNPNAVPTQLPAHNFAETNASHAHITPHDLQASSIGETNLRLQASVITQPPIQTPAIALTISQAIITQIREPMSEHLNAAYEALQNRSSEKPKDIIVQLSPAELGRVQIKFSFDTGERVVAHIAAENHETMAVLRQKSGLLSAQLKLSGFENIDLSFDAADQKNFSGQNSGAGFFGNNNGQEPPDFWQATKADLEGETPQSGIDDSAYPLRSQIGAQYAHIDIIL